MAAPIVHAEDAVKIAAGKFNCTVRIERPVPDTSLDGAGSGTWAFVALSRAELQDKLPSRSEQVSDGMSMATRPARLRMPWRSGITSDMRMLLVRTVGGQTVVDRVMQIVSGPAELGRRDGLEFMVEDYQPAGNPA